MVVEEGKEKLVKVEIIFRNYFPDQLENLKRELKEGERIIYQSKIVPVVIAELYESSILRLSEREKIKIRKISEEYTIFPL
jgi:hypothetical protein